jgi:UDP-galactopyranose mutase
MPVVVYSHLRWDSVFQRPHHLITRLAKQRPVVFIEEPTRANEGEQPGWKMQRPARNLLVAKPRTPIDAPGFADEQIPQLVEMTRRLLAWRGIGPHVAWLYTPMALELARALDPDAIVYDCMDELSSFLGAPADLREREAQLVQHADVVFTGGPSLYRAKRALHPAVRCFPSSVDAAHFRQANLGVEEPEDQKALARPRLGFYGVLDERLDADLVGAVADARPDWQIVMVGPIVKIDAASLPQRANLHYLGQRRYEELPAYLAGWDVCLLPFARNEATRFISPTKTLEYMAAERPIVTTPIHDVVEPYSDIVYAADTPEEFVDACERALAADGIERLVRVARMREVMASTSWDQTARAMLRELDRAQSRRRGWQSRRRVASVSMLPSAASTA